MSYLGSGKLVIKTDTVLSIPDIEIEIMTQDEMWNDCADLTLTAGDTYIYNAQNVKPEWNFTTKILTFEEYQKIISYLMSRLNKFETIELDQAGGEIEAKFVSMKSQRLASKDSNVMQKLSFGLVRK